MIYFYFLIVIILFGIIRNKSYKLLHSAIFSLFVALPYSSRGIQIGNDTESYYDLFLTVKSNIFDVSDLVLNVDPLYLLLIYISETFNSYLFIVSYLSFFFLAVSSTGGNYSWLGSFLFLLFMGYFNVATDQSRQTLAISFLIFSSSHNGILKYFSWIGSVLTHKSIIIFEIIDYLHAKLKLDTTLKAIAQLLIVFLLGYNLYIWKIASNFKEILALYNDAYVNDRFFKITGLNSNGLLIYRTVWALIFLIFFKKISNKYDRILVLGISILILSSGFMPLERIGLTFFFVGLFMSNKTKLKSLNSLVLLAYSAIYFISITILDLEKNGSSPWNCFIC